MVQIAPDPRAAVPYRDPASSRRFGNALIAMLLLSFQPFLIYCTLFFLGMEALTTPDACVRNGCGHQPWLNGLSIAALAGGVVLMVVISAWIRYRYVRDQVVWLDPRYQHKLIEWAQKYDADKRLANSPEQLWAIVRPLAESFNAEGVIPEWAGVDLLRGWAFYVARAYRFGGGWAEIWTEYPEILAIVEAVNRHAAARKSDRGPESDTPPTFPHPYPR